MKMQVDLQRFEYFEPELWPFVFVEDEQVLIEELNRLMEKHKNNTGAMAVIRKLSGLLMVQDGGDGRYEPVPFAQYQVKLAARAELREEQRLEAEEAERKLHEQRRQEAEQAALQRSKDEHQAFDRFMARAADNGLSDLFQQNQ